MEHLSTLNTNPHHIPKFAIVGYTQESDSYNQTHYFSYHKIVGERLTAGMPLTKDTASNLFNCLEGELFKYSFKGMLPKNLIHFGFKGNLQLLWYVHPKQHTLYFETKTGIASGKHPLPKLLFSLKGKRLRVFALARKELLTDTTLLYNAPLLNISRQGNVCMGNATIDYDGFEFYEDIMGFVEQQFFRSVFTESHHNDLVKGNLVKIMKQHFDKPTFDDGVLIPNKMTLSQLYEN